MPRVKKRIYAGAVLEQEVYTVPDRVRDVATYKYKPQGKTEEEKIRHRTEISRRHHARLINENFSPGSFYGTLTFDTENEVHTFEDARRIRDAFARRLKRIAPEAKIYIIMGRGRSTNRIHFHSITDGVEPADIMKKWTWGSVIRVESLREHNYYDGVDHGQDYTGLANYLFWHWTKEQGERSHKWYASRTMRQPTEEKAKEIRREYSPDRPPKTPKGYRLVECRAGQYGYLCFTYVKENANENRRN